MTSYAPKFTSNRNGKVSTIKMPAAFKIIQQPLDDPLNSIDSFSFAPNTSSTSPPSEKIVTQTAQPLSSSASSVTSPGPSSARPVHRAKSTPSLAHNSKKSAHKTSSFIPSNNTQESSGKVIPFPWNLLDNRFSNASSMTTTTTSTSDRSSSGSTMNPKFHPARVESPCPSSSEFQSDSSNSYKHISTIDIINDYTDDLNQPTLATSSEGVASSCDSANVHQPNNNINNKTPTTKSKLNHTSRPSSDSSSTEPPHPEPPSSTSANKTPKEPGRDRYGFKKQTQFVTEAQYDEWWVGYQQHVQRRKKKWVRLMKDSGLSTQNDQPVRFPAKSEKLKRYIRKGIPAEWRGNAWFFYAKGHEKLSSNKGLYDKLCAQVVNLKNSDTELIERDLHRTFPDNIHFRSETAPDGGRSRETEAVLIKSLRRVLATFSVYQPKIGYCQSLNFLAGLLLLFMDEEKAFWMLVIITQRYLPGVHEITLEGVNIDQGVLMLCVRESLPKLWNKIGVNFDGQHYNNILSKLPPITLCTAAWFMSGYIGILPIETVLRVWDCFFFEESKTFFRIALTIFKFAEPEVERLDDPMEIFQVVQTMPKRLIDASGLLAACFKRRNGFGHISQEEIRRLREFVRERRLQANLAALEETNNNSNNNINSSTASNTNNASASSTTALPSPTFGKRFMGSTGTTNNGGSSSSTKQNQQQQHPQPYNSNDLHEYNHFKHAPRPLHVQLSRRMKSLKISSHVGDRPYGK